ncbi:MAG: sulfotransferase [Chloroflexota bacterium]|nr:sulfotransferase [Chloroflexota bacterium]
MKSRILDRQIRTIKLIRDDPIEFLHTLLMTEEHATAVLENKHLFFIVGIGRSGTTFLSNLLNKIPDCAVYHEHPRDRSALVDAYRYPDLAREYLCGFRKRLIASRVKRKECTHYGEANSYLRYHIDALRKLWYPKLFHLVRDGRSVVRSAMNRNTFTSDEKWHSGQIYPFSEDPFADNWPDLNRFEKVCWYWMDANKFILKYSLPFIRFEDIIRSYEELTRQILVPLDITLPYSKWQETIEVPVNVSANVSFPEWKYWTRKQKKTFENICGDLMSRLGYSM